MDKQDKKSDVKKKIVLFFGVIYNLEVRYREIKFTAHSIQRMFERGISYDEVMEVIQSGEIIKEYPDDKPFPSVLILGFVKGKPLHVVVGKDEENDTGYLITVYEPNPAIWGKDFKERRNR